MEQTNKLNWIKKVTPLLYSLSLAGICLYIALRCRSWANLLLPWETGFVFFPLAAVYYLSNQLLCKKYLVAENRSPHLLGQRCHLCGHLPVDVDFVR